LKSLKKILRKNKGFSLIELMVAVGISGIVSIGIMQMMLSTTKISTVNAKKIEVFQILNRMNSILNDSESCELNFKNKNPKKGEKINSLTQLSKGVKKKRFEVGKIYGAADGRVTIKSMMLKNYENGKSIFEIVFFNGRVKDIKKKDLKVLTLKKEIIVRTNLYNPSKFIEDKEKDSNLIKNCMTDTGDFLKDLCESLEGDFSDLEYCRSITLRQHENLPAVKTLGNLTIEKGENLNGDLNVSNKITTGNNQTVEKDNFIKEKIKLGELKKQATVQINGNNLDINLPEKVNEIKLLFDNKEVSFKIDSSNNLTISDPSSKLKGAKLFLSKQNQIDGSPQNDSAIATRKWSLEFLKEILTTTSESNDQLRESVMSTITNAAAMEASEVTKIFAKKMCKKYFVPTDQFIWDEAKGCIPQAWDPRMPAAYKGSCSDFIKDGKSWQRSLISIDGKLQCKALPVLGCIEEANRPCYETMVWFSYDNSCDHKYTGGLFKWQRVNSTKHWTVCNKFGLISPDTNIEPATPPDAGGDDTSKIEALQSCSVDLNLGQDTEMEEFINILKGKTVNEQVNKLSNQCLVGMQGYGEFTMTECYSNVTGSPCESEAISGRIGCLTSSDNWCSVEDECKTELGASPPPNCNQCSSGKCVECLSNSDCSGSKPKCKTSSNLCVQCISNGDCSSSEKCENNRCVVDPTKVPKNVNWGSISKEYRCSEKGPGRAQKCCSAIGRKAVSIDQIKANLNEAKKAIRRISTWAIVAVEGGTFAGSGYNYEIKKGEHQSGGNAMCWK